MEMVLKVARAGRLGLRLDIQSFSMPSFGKSDFRHIVLRNAESLSKLSLIQVDEVLIPRSLENTKLANPLNLLNLDLVRMWDFAQLHPKDCEFKALGLQFVDIQNSIPNGQTADQQFYSTPTSKVFGTCIEQFFC